MLPPDTAAVAPHIMAGHEGSARGRRLQSTQHLDEGGLAGAVGAEETEDLAGPHGEADLVHRGERAEPAGEPLGSYRLRVAVKSGIARCHRRSRARQPRLAGEVMDEHVLQARSPVRERAGQLIG